MQWIINVLVSKSFSQYIPWILIGIPLFFTTLSFRLLFEYTSVSNKGALGQTLQGLESQILALVIGSVLAILIAIFRLHRFLLTRTSAICVFIALLTFILLALIPNPLVIEINNTKRWVDIGIFLIQPSEFLKIFIITTLAYFVREYRLKNHSHNTIFINTIGLFVLFILLSFAQSHYGLIFILGPVFLILIPWGEYLKKNTLSMVFLFVFFIGSLFSIFLVSERVQQRIFSLLDPSPSYHLEKNIGAIRSGGWRGVQSAEAYPTYIDAPEQVTDSIFSLISYEYGSAMSIFIIILFTLLFFAGLSIALSKRKASSFLALGLTVLLAMQVCMNISFSLLWAATGEVLPFFSNGGSALITFYVLIAMLFSIHRTPERILLRKVKNSENKRNTRMRLKNTKRIKR